MKAKKFLNIIGILLGIAAIVFGVVFIANPAESFQTENADYATFGADFYTYQYEATKYAVTNTAVTACNIRELGEKVALYAGMAFILAGLMIMLYFTKSLLDCSHTKTLPVAESIAVAPTETVMGCVPQVLETGTKQALPTESSAETGTAE